MKTLGVKKLIITTWIALTTMVFSVLGLTIINLMNSLNQIKNNGVSAANLTISNLSELQTFANDVNSGNNYSGKTVVLSSNINCGGASFYSIGTNLNNLYSAADAAVPFAGTFDGGGYIISNFKITDAFPHYTGGNAGELFGCGFFVALDKGAIVRNLGLQNYTITSHHDHNSATTAAYSGSTIGGIAGFLAMDGSGKASITNCLIDNLTINCYSEFADGYAVGGILGGNPHVGASITDCLINKITFKGTGEQFNSFSSVSGIVGNDPAVGSTIVTVSNCIVNKDNWSYSSEHTGATVNDFTKQSTSNCYSVANKTTGLNCTSDGGHSGSIWYYASDYSGWPMLRSFMTWETIYFSSEDTTKGTVTPSSIQIPHDAFESFSTYAEKYVDTSSNILTIYKQEINAKTENGYTFNHWSSNITTSAVSYTAYFEEITLTINFLPANNGDGAYNIYPTSSAFPDVNTYSISVSVGETLIVACEHDDKDNTKIVYYIGSRTITYLFSKKFTVDNYGYVSISMGVLGTQTIAIENFTTVPDLTPYGVNSFILRPTVKLKTYNTNFE